MPADLSLGPRWDEGPDTPALGTGEVHIWRIRLDPTSETLASRATTLSAAEQARAARFVFARDQRRFVAAHGGLRQVLARYAGQPPEQLRFAYGPQGKPFLVDTGDLEFNLSHSGELALAVVARARRVGIDLERQRSLENLVALAETCFAPEERATLFASPAELRRERFFRCWTRKEAYLKARGDGLSFPLDAFEVSLEDVARLIANRLEPEEPERWELQAFEPAPEYAAAVAVQRGKRLMRYAWYAVEESIRL